MMKTCATCPSPAKCKAAGRCLKATAMARGGSVQKANCGASMKPGQKSTPMAYGGMVKSKKKKKG